MQVKAATPLCRHKAAMHDAAALLSAVAAWCGGGGRAVTVGAAASSLFLTGLVGGFAHCAGMCGPFVLAQVAPEAGLRRIGAGALPAYHLGRVTTYIGLGALVGGLGGGVVEWGSFHGLLAAMLVFAAALFLLQGLKGLGLDLVPGRLQIAGHGVAGGYARIVAPLLRTSRFPTPPAASYRLGVALGFLPCGFLYSALVVAAASGGVWAGAGAMASFALGTVPSLVAVGWAGTLATQRWRGLARVAAAPLFLVNALILTGLAVRSLA